MYEADEIKFRDSLVVAVVSDFSNQLYCSSLYLLHFINVSLKCGDPNCTACSRCVRTRDFYNERISSLFLYLKLRAMNPNTLLAVLQLFSVCICHLRSLLMMIPAVELLSATVDWTCFSCFACCCVRCASQNIYLH